MFGFLGKLGYFIPRFGKKKTVVQTLEELEKEIKEFEKYKQKNELNERKYIAALVIYSIVFYIIGAIVYYIYFMPKNVMDRFKTSIPFWITPLLIYLIRRFLKWYFIKRSTHYERKLFDLKEEKKQILEDVKENETYKKAREILERFSSNIDITPPETPVRGGGMNNTTINPTSPYISQGGAASAQRMPPPPNNLVHRNVKNLQQQQQQLMSQSQQNLSKAGLDTTIQPQQGKLVRSNSQNDNSIMTMNQTMSQPAQKEQPPTSVNIAAPPSGLAASAQVRTLLPRPIINPNRTFFDKLLDFIVGEGPNNRYALICKNCHFHNGMALKEEFEYVAFRCAYCLFYNEARKTKLSVPKLNNLATTTTNSTLNNSNGKQRRESKPVQNETAAVESLHSSMSSSASLDDLGTISDPILASSSTSSVPTAATAIETGKAPNSKSESRKISVSKESTDEEKKNI